MKYDVIIIGGGPGGYTAAQRLACAGRSVCLFEAEFLGGTCLNAGCIPTKYLLDRAAALEKMRAMTADGILRGAGEFSFSAIGRGRAATVERLRRGLDGLMRTSGVTVVRGGAELRADRTVYCNGEAFTADDIIIATGSAPLSLPFPGAEYCLDSSAALTLARLPRRLCVIGGGVIGLELGSAYLSYGSDVTVIELQPEILGGELPEAARLLARGLTGRGMKLRCGTAVTAVEKCGGAYTVRTASGDTEADAVLLAAGRRPRTDGIDVAGLGLAVNRGGALSVDRYMRTNIAHIYAVGDVTGGYMLAHAAFAEAEIAAAAILGGGAEVDYRVMPRCVYTLPPIAAVGITPEQAARDGIETVVGRADYAANGMAAAEGEPGCVWVVTDKKNLTTVGVFIVGAGAPEMIAAASIAVERHYTADDWRRLTVAHPTLSECLKSAALAAV